MELYDKVRSNGHVQSSAPKGDQVLTKGILRRLDREGNRLPYSYAYHDPIPDGTPWELTPLRETYQRLASKLPGRAGRLKYTHNVELPAAIECVKAAVAQAEAERERWNAWVDQELEWIDREIDRMRMFSKQASQPHIQKAEALDKPLADAQLRAIEAVALTGRRYDPTNPSESDLLRVKVRSVAECAAQLEVPDPATDLPTRRSQWSAWMGAVALGGLCGLSAGVVWGGWTPGEIVSEPLTLLGLWIAGLFASVGAGTAIELAFAEVGKATYLRHHWTRRIAAYLGATGLSAAILGLDALLQREALARIARQEIELQSVDGTVSVVPNSYEWYLLPLALTLPYVARCAREGYRQGRREAAAIRIHQLQQETLRDDTERHLNRHDVQVALAAVLHVKELLRQDQEYQKRSDAACKRFEERITALEEARPQLQHDLSPEARQHIQELLDDLHAAVENHNDELTFTLAVVEPTIWDFALFIPWFRYMWRSWRQQR